MVCRKMGRLTACRGCWRPPFTPAHASWLDQAENLSNGFGHHDLRRGTRTNRKEFVAHIAALIADLVPILGLSRPESVPNLSARFATLLSTDANAKKKPSALEVSLGLRK